VGHEGVGALGGSFVVGEHVVAVLAHVLGVHAPIVVRTPIV
jgi:hypothetical protein